MVPFRRAHSPALVKLCISSIRRREAKYNPIACSETESTFAPMDRLTTIPLFLHASRSIQSVPTAATAMSLRCGVTSGESVCASKGMYENTTTEASWIREWSSESDVC